MSRKKNPGPCANHPDRLEYSASLCRPCYFESDPERLERRRAASREYLQKPEVKAHRKQYQRNWHHGVTQELFDAMLQLQEGLCALCGGEMLNPYVDHDHITGEIRGLLHNGCNQYLGVFEKGDDGIIDERCNRYLRWDN